MKNPRTVSHEIRTGGFTTMASVCRTRHATKEEAERSARSVLSRHAAAIVKLKNR